MSPQPIPGLLTHPRQHSALKTIVVRDQIPSHTHRPGETGIPIEFSVLRQLLHVTRALGTDLASCPRSSTDTHANLIAWARRDIVSQRRVLVIGYTPGVQIWDCHDLGSVTEILNLTSPSEQWILDDSIGRQTGLNTFVCAGVLPDLNDIYGDLLVSYRPLLRILMSDSDSTCSAFFVYSLKTHQIVQRISLPGIASTFEANHHFIVIDARPGADFADFASQTPCGNKAY
ncbi:hypothetical protein P691DRAFT_760359 [Macrolepiota fuliginosa MF-IS2]|uniref:Uncharacterized protein n=1 Tax=Macrolepiota fuliginosa MF-IS2 TaxID=1400762 RepID=A0A9P5XD58_9AGAR|nr:hypothetical protein P691DRAFT_760359 [Macrolepiota fuliginosa MF-IS2]